MPRSPFGPALAMEPLRRNNFAPTGRYGPQQVTHHLTALNPSAHHCSSPLLLQTGLEPSFAPPRPGIRSGPSVRSACRTLREEFFAARNPQIPAAPNSAACYLWTSDHTSQAECSDLLRRVT